MAGEQRQRQSLTSAERIAEREIDAVLAQAFLEDVGFCAYVRAELRIGGAGCADAVRLQKPHADVSGAPGRASEDGTIDLDPVRLLVENKISAAWSHTRAGLAQPERYTHSAASWGAQTLLIAPLRYIVKTDEALVFDRCLDYEALARQITGSGRWRLEAAAKQAMIATRNLNAATTRFFRAFEALAPKVAPRLVISRKAQRMQSSRTAHFRPKKSLLCHPGLPLPSIFLQLGQGRVRLLIDDWGRHLEALEAAGLHRPHRISLEQVKGNLATLGLCRFSPSIDTGADFASQRELCVAALRATADLCAWWDAHPQVIAAWAEIVARAERRR